MPVVQLHKRLNRDQVAAVFESYRAKEIKIEEACGILGVKRSRFFALLSEYLKDPQSFSVKHKGNAGNRSLSPETETVIIKELEKEKELIDNKDMPVRTYNYSAVRDALLQQSIAVSVPTIIKRAKDFGFYLGKRIKKLHEREVLTTMTGELAQHDSSHHLWSPFMDKKLYLITTIDDYSRLLLYAELVERETTWAHICALKSVFLRYGCPMKYYADQHAIFRYVKDRDKFRPWTTYTKFTDDVDTQWRQILKECHVSPIYALSPQAKGKIERPYRWIQDRMVRTASKEKLTQTEEVRGVLRDLVEQYNTRWVHSTTREIPIVRFENAQQERRSLFSPLGFEGGQTVDDIFALRIDRVADRYRKVSLQGHEMRVPNGTPRETVSLRLVPDQAQGLIKVRFWQRDVLLGETVEKLEDIPIVQF